MLNDKHREYYLGTFNWPTSMATLGLFFTLLVSIFLPSWGQIDLGESVTSSSYGDIIDCPPKEVIYPCQCWESTLYDAWQMQCDSVYSESELANVFHKDLGTKTIGNLMVYGNIFLRKLHNGVFGDYKFKTFEVLFTSLVSMEPDVLINSTEILRELTVAFTSISEVPVDYRFQNLEFLQLKGNKIPSMPILDLQALNTLDMGWNPLKEIPSDPFRNLPNLKRLGLSGCQIQSLPQKLFAYPEKMEYMEMFENEIRHISEDTFSGLTAITTLDLSQNQISTVAPGAFTGLSNAELGLQDNAITTLEEEIWQPILSSNVSIWLAGNPLECGCDVVWIVSNPQFQQLLNTTWHGIPMCQDGEGLLSKTPDDFLDC